MTETQTLISSWLGTVGSAVGVPLALDENGHCNIVFGNQLECMVEVPEDSTAVFIYAPLKRPPDETAARIACLEQALELNLFSLATGGATVSYDRRTDQIVLSFSREAAQLNEEFFKALLGDILDLAIDLHARLSEPTIPSEPLPDPAAGSLKA
jgi:hypothetical protein